MKKTQQQIQRAIVETLEDRKLLSSVTFANGILTITGDADTSNTLRVTLSGDGRSIYGLANNAVRSVATDKVTQIKIVGGTQNDEITVDQNIKIGARINGNGGYDTILGGGGNDTIVSTGGEDQIDPRNGNNQILSGQLSQTPPVAEAPAQQGGQLSSSGSPADSSGSNGTDQPQDSGQTPPPAESEAPTAPVEPEAPVAPVEPEEPTAPTEPNEPAAPAEPQEPTAPVTPSQPEAPVTPAAPSEPTAPVEQTPNTDAQAPVAVITTLQTSVMAGSGIHVEALDSTLVTGDVLDHRFVWDFGDAGSNYNQIVGYNAAHVYDKAGTYTITLTVTDAAGRTSTTTQQVNITADTRKVVQVDNTAQLAAALANLTDNTTLLLKRGVVYNIVGDGYWIRASNVVIGAYGQGNNPVLRLVNGGSTPVLLNIEKSVSNVTIENLTFDSDQGNNTDKAGTPSSIFIRGGKNITIRNNTFLNVNYAIESSLYGGSVIDGILVQGNIAPLNTGIRSYFVWAEGSDWVIMGNKVANSTREHNIRVHDYNRVLVFGNDLTQIKTDKNPNGDTIEKSCIWLMDGQYGYIAQNTTHNGYIRTGTLPNDGSLHSSWNVIEDNIADESSYQIQWGTDHLAIRNNTLQTKNFILVSIFGYNKLYNNTVNDVRVEHNNATISGNTGTFVRVQPDSTNISITNNTLYAPNLVGGLPGQAPVQVMGNTTAPIILSDGNVWQLKKGTIGNLGGYIYLGSTWAVDGIYSADRWNNLPQVGNDTFVDLSKVSPAALPPRPGR